MSAVIEAAPVLGSVITIVLGGVGLVRPRFFMGVCGLEPSSNMGRLEMRAVFGGCLITLGAVCLVSAAPAAYLLAGLLWLTSATVKLLMMGVDRVSVRAVLAGLAADITVGLLMLSGYYVY